MSSTDPNQKSSFFDKYTIGALTWRNNKTMSVSSMKGIFVANFFFVFLPVFLIMMYVSSINNPAEFQLWKYHNYAIAKRFLPHSDPIVQLKIFSKDTREVITDGRGKAITKKYKLSSLRNNPSAIVLSDAFWIRLLHAFWIALIAYIGMIIMVNLWFYRRGSSQVSDRIIRGVTYTDKIQNVNRQLKKKGISSDISIGGLNLVKDSETRHIELKGTTGTGKTVLIKKLNQFLDKFRPNNHRIFVDVDGEYAKDFYNSKTDVILNVFDKRTAYPDIFDEITSEQHYDLIANTLVPMPNHVSDPFWYSTARTLLSSIIREIHLDDKQSNTYENILNYAIKVDLEKLEEFLSDTYASQLVSQDIKKTAASIRSILLAHVKPLSFLIPLEKDPKIQKFSFRKWMRMIETNDKKSIKKVFLTFKDDELDAVATIMTMWINLFNRSVMSLSRNRLRRVWLFIDELTKLGKLSSLNAFLKIARNYGVCTVLGYQNSADLRKIYGQDEALSIASLLSTKFYFRVPEESLAKEVSANLGYQDVYRARPSKQLGVESVKDGSSIASDEVTRAIVTPSEITQLPDLTAYVILPTQVPRTKITLQVLTGRERLAIKVDNIFDFITDLIGFVLGIILFPLFGFKYKIISWILFPIDWVTIKILNVLSVNTEEQSDDNKYQRNIKPGEIEAQVDEKLKSSKVKIRDILVGSKKDEAIEIEHKEKSIEELKPVVVSTKLFTDKPKIKEQKENKEQVMPEVMKSSEHNEKDRSDRELIF